MSNPILILNINEKDPNINKYEPIRNTRRYKYFQKINDKLNLAENKKYENSAKQIEQIISLDEIVLNNLTTAIHQYKKKKASITKRKRHNKKSKKSKKNKKNNK
jgi:hypothetical protein